MDGPLLKRGLALVGLMLAAAMLASCTLLDDPILEIDPALVRDSSFSDLAPSEARRVARGHLLESFGHYGCGSCPDAEGRLEPYLRPGESPAYRPGLVIVNYHVAFTSPFTDPWITPGTQARHDRFGFTSLPQVKMDGSNAPFGIREKDVRYYQGEYDSLIARAARDDSAWIDLRFDSASTRYDSAAQRWEVGFTLLNRAATAQGPLTLRVMAVKNRAVVISRLPNHPWEVIVVETTDKDSSGAPMTLARMPSLSSKSWRARLPVTPEGARSPAPETPENPRDYALVLFVENGAGIVQNVISRNLNPVR
jgi:hypothetical protein